MKTLIQPPNGYKVVRIPISPPESIVFIQDKDNKGKNSCPVLEEILKNYPDGAFIDIYNEWQYSSNWPFSEKPFLKIPILRYDVVYYEKTNCL